MDFVFMLTRADRTIADALDVLDDIREVGIRHIGFKDVGIEPAAAQELHRRIKAMGATSYLEVVSTTPEACLQSTRVARELGVDYLLGGTQHKEILEILGDGTTKYLPFPGQPFGHPTKLRGAPADITADCMRYGVAGAAGVDLLAYRSIDADPIELVRAARAAVTGTLLVAGAIATPAQVRALRDARADAFTVGSAVFDGSFAPHVGSMRSQLKAVLDAAA
jgi:hypothetical protein